MSADRRACPVCKKQPPSGQEWRDYDGHVAGCARAYYDRERHTDDVINRFGTILRDLAKVVS